MCAAAEPWFARLALPDAATLKAAGLEPSDVSLCARGGDDATLRRLLSLDASAAGAADAADGYTPLHWACCYGRLGCVELLLSRGACPNARSHDGWTPTCLAAGKGFVECLEACARRGGDVCSVDVRGWGALHRAAWNGHAACVAALLDRRVRHRQAGVTVGF